jgi:hypothetical protein
LQFLLYAASEGVLKMTKLNIAEREQERRMGEESAAGVPGRAAKADQGGGMPVEETAAFRTTAAPVYIILWCQTAEHKRRLL